MFLELVIISADTKQKCICQNTQKMTSLFQVWENVELAVTSQFHVMLLSPYSVQERLLSSC